MKVKIIGSFVNFSTQAMSDYEKAEYFVKKVVDNRSGKTGNVNYLWKWKGHGSPKVHILCNHEKRKNSILMEREILEFRNININCRKNSIIF